MTAEELVDMTVDDIFQLRKQGRTEAAYEAARALYANDKGRHASRAMFWTAVDMLKQQADEGHAVEARRILTALERLLEGQDDEKGWMTNAMARCRALVEKSEKRAHFLDDAPEHLQMGVWGEDLAVAMLREKGYVILERDWHSKHRDIDIIAQKGDCIVFVEVKTRRSRDFGDPEYAIDYDKRRNLRIAIANFLQYKKFDGPWRFDVITVVGIMGATMPDMNHIEDFSLT